MYGKKHIVITAVLTAVVVWLLSGVFHLRMVGYDSGDTLMRAKQFIEKTYVDELTEEQKQRMLDYAISGLIYGLGDQYTSYLNEEDLLAYQETKEEVYKGIGVSINFDGESEKMTVVSPYDGSPAQKAGILPGDVIEKVGKLEVSAETYNDVLEYIQKGDDDDIKMVISRDGETKQFTVRREEIKRQSVSYKMYGDRIGYIRISEFIHSTKADFSDALVALQKQKMEALIIDLRNNPGGYADSVIHMTDELLPEGVIAYLEDNQGKRRYFNSDKNSLDMPIAVLINQGTASASELMAGSLQAHGLATVIGEKSYGKAVGQSLYPLTNKTAIYITDSRYYTPKGECIDGIGIMPDIAVGLDKELVGKISTLEPSEDAQLAQALKTLSARIGQ